MDITEQKLVEEKIRKSEDQLRKSKERLQTGLNVANIALAEIDYTTSLVTLSAEAAAMYGLPLDNLTISRTRLHHTFHPDDKEQLLELIDQSLNPDGDGLIETEHRVLFPSGEVRCLKVNKQVFFDKSRQMPLYGILAAQDITAKKQIEEEINRSEAKFRTLSETTPQMVWTALPDGKKNFFNKYYLDYTGLTFEELEGDGWQKIIYPDDMEQELQQWHLSLKTGMDFKNEKRIRKHDGTYLWYLSLCIAQKNSDGNIIGWIGTNTEIDDQKKNTEELLKAKTKAETATEIAEHAVMAKQQFLSNMSHEIRTPMNAIIGFTKVLSKTELTEKQKEYLQAIKSSGNTLIVLINDILDLAKVDAGKMIFLNSPFKISHTITTILHLFETKIQESNLELAKEYDSRIPEIVLGDSVRLHQILINLLSNAIKFTAKGKIIVSVDLLNEDEEKVTLEIKVTDTGIGIPPNKMEAIFENFEQAHAITSSLYGGTGLGLAIVKQLVEKQGGAISVKSKVDEGSTFSFTLSFQKTNADPDSYREEKEDEQYKTEIKPLKVLVVEDVKLNQLLMRTVLDDFNFAWDIADNGKIAIEKLQTNSYDIILMDLQMPIMNGFEATEHIRNKMNLQIPIIALTADVTTVDVEKCKAVGMNDYIAKPVDENLLYNKILGLIKSK